MQEAEQGQKPASSSTILSKIQTADQIHMTGAVKRGLSAAPPRGDTSPTNIHSGGV